jgi:hypothetical protein
VTWYEKYVRHYKYRTTEEKVYETRWNLPRRRSVSTERGFVHLSGDGCLTIKCFYGWDGASGPTLDTPSTMFASLVHDALYQLLREGKLPPEYREKADLLLEIIMLRQYTGKHPSWHAFRVRCWGWGLRHLAAYAAAPEDD